MPSVEWEEYRPGLPEVTDADLDQLEAERGVKLPASYRATVKEHRGDIPVPHVIDFAGQDAPVNALYFVRKGFSGDGRSYNAWTQIDFLDDMLPEDLAKKFVPFTSDSGQIMFAFDYRRGETPGVVVIDKERDLEEDADEAIIPVADSFEDFLDKLHD